MFTVPLGNEVVVIVNGAGWILKIVLPLTLPIVAEMVVVPVATPLASAVELMVAMLGFDEAHVA